MTESSRHVSEAQGSLLTHESRLWLVRWMVLSLLAAAAFSAYLTRHALAVVNTTIQQELGFTYEHFGYVFGAFSLGYLLFQIPGGWLGQRIGTRLTLPLAAALWSVLTLATAFATNLTVLIVVRFLFGVAQAALVPNQAKVLQDWIPIPMRGIASSVPVVAMSVGAVASLSLTSYLMETWPWRKIFVLYSGVGLVWGVIFVLWFRDRPWEMRWLRCGAVGQDVATPIESSLPAQSAGIRFGVLVGSVSLWGLVCLAFFRSAGYNLMVTFLPAVLQYSCDLKPEEAGRRASWSLVSYIVGSVLGGVLTDGVQRWTGSKLWSRTGVGSFSLGLAGVGMIVAGFTSTATGLVISLCVASLFASIAGAPVWAATLDVGGRNSALVMGWANTSAALAGLAISPAVGRLVDAIHGGWGNWSLLYWLHAIFYLLAAVSWFAILPDRSSHLIGDDHAV